MNAKRLDGLRALLPSKDSEYLFDSLSISETEALESAFGDGFGDVGAVGYRPALPPPEVRSGLVRHKFFVKADSEYDHGENPDEFWDWCDDRPPPWEFCPLGFELRRLSLYFQNQLERFCEQLIRERPGYGSLDKESLEEEAAGRLYEKPWYEYHAVQLIDWINGAPDALGKPNVRFSAMLASGFSGTLGRLVEQYYWRFRFEKAAIAGVTARTGASTGGKAKAKLHEAAHFSWQSTAAEIWKVRPNLNKTAVAKIVKIRLRVPQTPKHIARFIKRP